MEFDVTKKTLKRVIDSIDPIVDQIIFDLEEDQFHTAGVDPGNVVMVDLTLEESAFEKYDGDGKSRGVDIEKLSEVIGMAGSSDVIHAEELEPDSGGQKLHLEFEGLSYTMGLVAVDSIRSGRDRPELEWGAELTIPVGELKRGKNACAMVSDNMVMEVDDETFYMRAEGDIDDTELEIDPLPEDADEDEAGLRFDGDPDDCSTKYSLEFLGNIIDAAPNDAVVSLSFGEGIPALLSFDIAGGAGRVEYFVAPRLER